MRRASLIAPAYALAVMISCFPIAIQGADSAAVIPKTGKERQAGKAYDPQRVNDCKVPAELRDDKKRSADCGEEAKAAAEKSEGSATEETSD